MNRTGEHLTAQRCYEILGLRPDASRRRVRAAYRRLALRYHPDRNPDDPASLHRFIDISRAYTELENLFALHRGRGRLGRCHRCGRVDELLEALDGTRCCADCLVLVRHNVLPPETITVIRFGSAIVLLTVAVYCLSAFVTSRSILWGLTGAACAAGAFFIVAITSLRVRRTV